MIKVMESIARFEYVNVINYEKSNNCKNSLLFWAKHFPDGQFRRSSSYETKYILFQWKFYIFFYWRLLLFCIRKNDN